MDVYQIGRKTVSYLLYTERANKSIPETYSVHNSGWCPFVVKTVKQLVPMAHKVPDSDIEPRYHYNFNFYKLI